MNLPDYDPILSPLQLPVQQWRVPGHFEHPVVFPEREGATPGTLLWGAFGEALWHTTCADRQAGVSCNQRVGAAHCLAPDRCVVPWLYKPQAAPAYPALLILLFGYGFASIFQWNRPLLLALGRPGLPVLIALCSGLVELLLIFWLVPQHGYLYLAAILSGYFIVSVGITVWSGLLEMARQAQNPSPVLPRV